MSLSTCLECGTGVSEYDHGLCPRCYERRHAEIAAEEEFKKMMEEGQHLHTDDTTL